jgi:hypothetical protein
MSDAPVLPRRCLAPSYHHTSSRHLPDAQKAGRIKGSAVGAVALTYPCRTVTYIQIDPVPWSEVERVSGRSPKDNLQSVSLKARVYLA